MGQPSFRVQFVIWIREMASLVRQYIESDRAYRAALKQLKREIKEQARK